MDSSSSVLYAAAGLPSLASTGITFIYFFLKACRYIFNAISRQTEGRVATATSAQIREKKVTQKFANKYREIFQNNMAEGHNDPQGPFFYQEGGKTYASLPLGMLQDIQKSPLFEKMQKIAKQKASNSQKISFQRT